MSEWVKCSDRLPEGIHKMDVTHWMPLPEPPTEEANELDDTEKGISEAIQSAIAPIFCRYKDHPLALVDALSYLLEATRRNLERNRKLM